MSTIFFFIFWEFCSRIGAMADKMVTKCQLEKFDTRKVEICKKLWQ
jgi:hypothetical protein